MIKFENTEVSGFDAAFRAMRNPLNSWNRSDSRYCSGCETCNGCGNPFVKLGDEQWVLGKSDKELAQRLIRGGSEHRKFLRQIQVWVDITAPLYWWKEEETYKVGTTSNSCSTMHKITAKEFTLDDFSCEHLFTASLNSLKRTIEDLNACREGYLDENISRDANLRKAVWWQLIQLLPSSYNQKRTLSMSYENVRSMYHQRKNHKLDEWSVGFVQWAESLPFAAELITYTGKEENGQ